MEVDVSDRLDAVMEALARRRQDPPAECLSDATVERLADGTLSAERTAAARAHLEGCLSCLQVYAAMRSLLEVATLDEPAAASASPLTAARGDRVARATSPWRRVAAIREPLPWTVAAAAAAVLLTWTLGVVPERAERVSSNPTSARSTVELAADGTRRVTGTVAEIRDSSTQGMPAHVIALDDAGGARYTVFVWGAPTIVAGDAITIEGAFSPDAAIGGRMAYKGVASVVERSGSR
jgi:hypothetical protein